MIDNIQCSLSIVDIDKFYGDLQDHMDIISLDDIRAERSCSVYPNVKCDIVFGDKNNLSLIFIFDVSSYDFNYDIKYWKILSSSKGINVDIIHKGFDLKDDYTVSIIQNVNIAIDSNVNHGWLCLYPIMDVLHGDIFYSKNSILVLKFVKSVTVLSPLFVNLAGFNKTARMYIPYIKSQELCIITDDDVGINYNGAPSLSNIKYESLDGKFFRSFRMVKSGKTHQQNIIFLSKTDSYQSISTFDSNDGVGCLSLPYANGRSFYVNVRNLYYLQVEFNDRNITEFKIDNTVLNQIMEISQDENLLEIYIRGLSIDWLQFELNGDIISISVNSPK